MALQTRLAATAAAATLFLVPALVGAQALTPPVIAQAKAAGIIDHKRQRSGAENKLDEKLLFTHRAVARGARRNTVTQGVPGFVQGFIDREVGDDLATYVSIRASVTSDLAAWLKGIGARDVQEYPQYGNVTATVPVSELVAIGARPEVNYVGPRELAETNRWFPTPDGRQKALQDAIEAIPNTGATAWKGVTAHKADFAHAAGITGTGVKVCVMSDGVNTLAARQAAGELPAVTILSGQAGSGDEGTAMLEIIADMAPGASLGFATAFNGTSSFAANILALRNTVLCDIIVDDVSYFGEAAFEDDTIAQAVNTVTAAGALYFSSAANSGNLTHGNSGTYEGDFLASALALPSGISGLGETGAMHKFPSGLPYTALTSATSFVSLKWSDKTGSALNDYDLFVTTPGGGIVLGYSANSQGFNSGGTIIPSGSPWELATCDVAGPGPCDSGGTCNPTTGAFCRFPVGSWIYAVLYDGSGQAPRALRVDTHRGIITAADRTTGSTYGHNAAASALSVGSVDLRSVGATAPFPGTANVTSYSSDGPRKVFYSGASAQSAISPGNFLFGTNGGTTLPKVDLAAGDCGATTTVGFTTFCGTSAAAPTAAAIAALIKSAKPTATKAQITTALLNSAIDIEQAGTDRNSGVGIVMADMAARNILTALTFGKSFLPSTITAGGSTTLTITVTNSNAVALNGVAFTDTYPSPIVNAGSPNASVSGAGCSGTRTATAGATTLAVTNATIPANTTCTFTVLVTVNTGGSYSDSSGTLTTPIGLNTTGSSTGSLNVLNPVTRTAVASFGSDSNVATSCTLTTPCRSFATALSVTVPGGEIIALNAAGYGAVTIDKSVSIIANGGFYAGITAATGDGITIATPGVKVLLRGLNINGIGGTNGINMTAGTALTMDNCAVSNFAGSGLLVDATGSSVRISNSFFSGNGVDGVQVAQGRADVVRSRANGNARAGFAAMTTTGSAIATLNVVDSFASGNLYGFAAIASAVASETRLSATRITGASNDNGLRVETILGTANAIVGGSMFSQNTTGMFNSGTLKSLGNNLVDLNGANTSGTVTTVPGL